MTWGLGIVTAVQFCRDADVSSSTAVNPGFGGQKFIEYQVEKVRRLRQMCDDAGVAPWIEVDGGINGKNAYKVCPLCYLLQVKVCVLWLSVWKLVALHVLGCESGIMGSPCKGHDGCIVQGTAALLVLVSVWRVYCLAVACVKTSANSAAFQG